MPFLPCFTVLLWVNFLSLYKLVIISTSAEWQVSSLFGFLAKRGKGRTLKESVDFCFQLGSFLKTVSRTFSKFLESYIATKV